MSAEDLGRRLASEIETETLDQLLSAIQSRRDPYQKHSTGVPPVDQLFAHHANLPWPIARNDGLSQDVPPPLLEIASSGPGNGRLSLVYLLLSLAVLPASIGDVHVHGRHGCVVVLDTDLRFDVARLVVIMRHLLSTAVLSAQSSSTEDRGSKTVKTITEADIERIMTQALSHIHVFRPQSFASLEATVDSLEAYLFDNTRHGSGMRSLSAIVVTDATAFSRVERDRVAHANLTFLATSMGQNTTSVTGIAIPSNANPIRNADFTARTAVATAVTNLFTLLATVAERFSAQLIYSASESLSLSTTTSTNLNANTDMRKSVYLIASRKVSLTVTKRPVRGFPPGTSVAEAMRDAKERNAAVGRAIFDIRFDTRLVGGTGSGTGSGQHGFAIRIHGEGIDFLDPGT